MRLVIIRHDAADQVSLASPATFPDAEAVRAELVRLFAEGSLDAGGAYSLLDLDTGAPLVIVEPSPPAAGDVAAEVMDEPVSEAEAFFAEELPEPPAALEADAEPEVVAVEEPFASGVLEEVAEDAAVQPADDATDGAQQWPWDLPAAEDGVPEAAEGAAAESETPDNDDDADEPGSEPAAEDPALNDDLAAVAASLAEKMAEEPALVSETIRLGGPDEDDAPEIDEDETAEEAAGPAEEEVSEPQGVLDAGNVPAPPVEEAASAEDEAVVEEAAGDDPQADEPGDGDAEKVYEPGALNMNDYTCDDCVYVNTCPNQHQKKPAACGSFQWKSV